MRQAVETARVQLEQAQQNLKRQQDLWARSSSPRARRSRRRRTTCKAAESALQEREKHGRRAGSRIEQERATLESARYDLSKVRIESPIDGIVTRRNIQEGETAVIGTMNNAGTVLLTLADMSVIQAEVEVDETNIPNVQIGQLAKITIDAIPDQHVQGARHRNRQQPDSDGRGAAAGDAGHELQGGGRCSTKQMPDVRPGFTCTADITTATRQGRDRRCRFRPSPCASWSTTRTGRSSRQPRDRQAQRGASAGTGRRRRRS